MIVNRQNLNDLFQTFSVAFNLAMEEVSKRVHDNQLMEDELVMPVPVTGAATTHAWMNQISSMKEWIGDRIVGDIGAGKLVITNRKFENTIGIPRDDIEDDQYGTFTPLVRNMGAAAQAIWMDLAIEALLNNDKWADGNPFFCAGRKLSGKSGVLTNAVTTALSAAAVEKAIADIGGWLLHGGRAASVTPRLLVVGPSLLGLAKKIVEADLVSDGTTTTSNVSTARMLKVRSDSRLVGAHAGKWYVLGEKNTIRPVAVQKRRQPKLTRMDADTDEVVFMRDEFRYGTDARGGRRPPAAVRF